MSKRRFGVALTISIGIVERLPNDLSVAGCPEVKIANGPSGGHKQTAFSLAARRRLVEVDRFGIATGPEPDPTRVVIRGPDSRNGVDESAIPLEESCHNAVIKTPLYFQAIPDIGGIDLVHFDMRAGLRVVMIPTGDRKRTLAGSPGNVELR